jgi:hypothetical protein
VIDDSFNELQLNLMLFRQQTDVGKETTLVNYREKMTVTLRNRNAGQSLPEALWVEDGHLVIFFSDVRYKYIRLQHSSKRMVCLQ